MRTTPFLRCQQKCSPLIERTLVIMLYTTGLEHWKNSLDWLLGPSLLRCLLKSLRKRYRDLGWYAQAWAIVCVLHYLQCGGVAASAMLRKRIPQSGHLMTHKKFWLQTVPSTVSTANCSAIPSEGSPANQNHIRDAPSQIFLSEFCKGGCSVCTHSPWWVSCLAVLET